MAGIDEYQSLFTSGSYDKIKDLNNNYIEKFLADSISHLNPASVFVWAGTPEQTDLMKQASINNSEESALSIAGHTVHFDGINDQARDKKHTKFLIPADMKFDPNLNSIDRETGLQEIQEITKNIMTGKRMYVLFFSLGPVNSIFSIRGIQMTDSPYVAHTETILYRPGYESFKNMEKKDAFFKFIHSAGRLKNALSIDIEKRRIYIDLIKNTVYSVNAQYGGNTIGLKKLAMRLAIQLAEKEGWLTEHMLVMGVNGPKGRTSYFTGAFPSGCGKTSTAMLPNEKIVGDDIAYLRKKDDGVYAVNMEKGIFGIIEGVNSKDDTIIWKILHTPNEVIFSNLLVGPDNMPYWGGTDAKIPEKGRNFAGQWFKGKTDENGKPVAFASKNARFTVSLSALPNLDENSDNPDGVKISGIIYGGRDSDTSVPVEESFDWIHGIVTKGAAIESETTAATLGKSGVRRFNPMSNLDFLSIPIARYISSNINFAKDIKNAPRIFGVNYFLLDKAGNFLNGKVDKSVWLKWMEGRCHNDFEAIKTPTGLIPRYEDLKSLFYQILKKDYSKRDYEIQFTLRIRENLNKIERITTIYREKIPETPDILFDVLSAQKERLINFKNKFGEYISPFLLK